MKQFRLVLIVLLIIFSAGIVIARCQTTGEILPGNFGQEAFKHIEYLASMGHRQVGSENDIKAIHYLFKQFSKIGLHVETQPFEFESFEYSDAEFSVNNRKLEVYALGVTPSQKTRYVGEAILIDWKKFDTSDIHDLKGKCLITNDWSAHFRLMPYMPELIVYLNQAEFKKIEKKEKYAFDLKMSGRTERFKSANVIAQIGKPAPFKKEIILTAHFDTYRRNNPGASDNASGIGVIVELARYFKQMEDDLPCVIRFIAFGGEEIGIIGSRNYLSGNKHKLENCELLFNIDDVGGHGKIIVEKNGHVKGVSNIKGQSQIPEDIQNSPWEGVSSMWRLLPASNDLLNIFTASNHPAWLVEIVEKSINELGYEVTYTGTQGSDQLAFAQAGIVTSGVGIIGDHRHSPEDKAEYINKDSLKKAGEIAVHIVTNTMKRIAGDTK